MGWTPHDGAAEIVWVMTTGHHFREGLAFWPQTIGFSRAKVGLSAGVWGLPVSCPLRAEEG